MPKEAEVASDLRYNPGIAWGENSEKPVAIAGLWTES
jgi:hypothetical protein